METLALYETDLDQERADVIYLRGLARSTAKNQASALRFISEGILGIPIERMNWSSLTPKDLRLIKRDLLDAYKRSTAKRMLMAVMGTLRVARINGLLDPDVYENIKLEVSSDPIKVGSSDEFGNVLNHGELKLLLDVCSIRDRAVIAMGCPGGMRRIEIKRLDLDAIGENTIFVAGKTADRKVQMLDGMRRFLNEWILERGDYPGVLFPNPQGSRLSDRGLDKIIIKNGKLADVPWLRSHDLRRTTITMMLEAGCDPITVAKHVGHSDPAQTMRYDRRSAEQRLEWLEKTFSFLS